MNTKRRDLTEIELLAADKIKHLWKKKQKEYKQKYGRILSQEKAAFDLGWQTQSAFYQYLSGKSAINIEALLKFSAYFNVNPDEISPSIAKKLKGHKYAVTGDGSLNLVAEEIGIYDTKPNQDALDKAIKFLFKHVGVEVIEHQGAQWTAQKTIKLYDLFLDPASQNLNPTTILKLIN